MPTLRTFTRQDARRLAISRQYLDGRTPPPLLDLIRDLGCVQLDPIRHVERTHLLVLWSRLGPFDEAELERLRWQDRALFEYWAHAASLVLTEDYPVHRWRMDLLAEDADSRQARAWKTWFDEEADTMYPLLDHILAQLQQNGPMLSRQFEEEAAKFPSRWYNGRYVPRILDYLWSKGEVMVHGRPGNQRLWGLPETFWPETAPLEKWQAEQVTSHAAQKSLRALGVATDTQIKWHYTRQTYPSLPIVLKKLTQENVIEKVQIVENGQPLKGNWYIHSADMPLLEAIQSGDWQPRTALLSPFDNLICDRDRTEMLWDFFYRIEIYVPAAKREYGYYVLPILHGDRLIGRIDSKMDRQTNTWHIHNVYAEPGAPGDKKTVKAVGTAVQNLATCLGANQINWGHLPSPWKNLAQT
ncbi:MAG TPA: crosslink repair DNA glycosylase YcaQ family protein [Chloroflexota bacterium]|nr:crosslink repair DNA glycosylase YcaQ family protein [Chloroflexota bacterium]